MLNLRLRVAYLPSGVGVLIVVAVDCVVDGPGLLALLPVRHLVVWLFDIGDGRSVVTHLRLHVLCSGVLGNAKRQLRKLEPLQELLEPLDSVNANDGADGGGTEGGGCNVAGVLAVLGADFESRRLCMLHRFALMGHSVHVFFLLVEHAVALAECDYCRRQVGVVDGLLLARSC